MALLPAVKEKLPSLKVLDLIKQDEIRAAVNGIKGVYYLIVIIEANQTFIVKVDISEGACLLKKMHGIK